MFSSTQPDFQGRVGGQSHGTFQIRLGTFRPKPLSVAVSCKMCLGDVGELRHEFIQRRAGALSPIFHWHQRLGGLRVGEIGHHDRHRLV